MLYQWSCISKGLLLQPCAADLFISCHLINFILSVVTICFNVNSNTTYSIKDCFPFLDPVYADHRVVILVQW